MTPWGRISRDRWTRDGAVLMAAVIASVSLVGTAAALEPSADEQDRLKACEAKLCSLVLKKAPAEGALACKIDKTWAKRRIVDGVKEKKISWTFGDARCGVDLKAPNAEIVAAVSKPAHELKFAPHIVKCEIERSEGVTDIEITMAPKIVFKSGKAEKAWLNVSKIEAPTVIKGAIWTVSRLEDNFGLFHGQMISEINEFLHEKCAKRHGS